MKKKTLPLVLLWVLLLSLCSQTVSATKVTIPNQEHFIIETISDPESVDPAWAYDTASMELIGNVYEPLFDSANSFILNLGIAIGVTILVEGVRLYIETRGAQIHIRIMTSLQQVDLTKKDITKWEEFSPDNGEKWFLYKWVDLQLPEEQGHGKLSQGDTVYMRKENSIWGYIFNTYDEFDVASIEPAGQDVGWFTMSLKDHSPIPFHNGASLTPEDVEYSFERLLVQDRSGGPAWMINEPLFGNGWPDKSGWPEAAGNPIDTAVESNLTHAWFNLPAPNPTFLEILSGPWASIVSKDFCIANGDWDGTWTNWKSYADPEVSPLDAAGDVMCGTGPYMLDYWTHGVEWSIVRFEDYWGGWPAPHTPRYLDRYTEKVVYEWGTRFADLMAGSADTVYVPTAFLPEVIENWPTEWDSEQMRRVDEEGNPEYYAEGIRCLPGLPTLAIDAAMFLTFDINPASGYVGTGSFPDGIPLDFFSDRRIRKAFAHAMDYDTFINEIFWGEGEQPSSCVINGIAYNNPANPKYDFDLTKVADYFQAASADPSSPAYGVWDTGFKMTITYNTGNVPRETTALMIKDYVEQVFEATPGTAEITVLGVPWSTFLGEMVGYPTFRSLMPLFIMGYHPKFPDPHDLVTAFMHTYGRFSYFQSYSNSTVDALIAEGIATPDGSAREAIYHTLQLMYYQDAPSVCIVQPLKRHWERDWVQGWHYNPLYPGLKYFKHLWKGLTGDINGDNRVDILDDGVLNVHWSGPPSGPLGYDKIADVCPELQYNGIPKVWNPALEEWVPHPSIGAIDIFDAAKISAHWLEEVDP